MKRFVFWLTLLRYAFAMLFLYASVVKLFDFQLFQQQLSQSPLIGPLAEPVSYLVIGVELVVALLLLSDKFLRVGLYGFFSMMVMFSAYIFVLLHYGSFVPCSCGGILEAMGWEEHLIFNLVFVVLSAVALYQYSLNEERPWLKTTSLLTFGSICTVVVMWYVSMEVRERANPFVRYYTKHMVRLTRESLHGIERPYVIGQNDTVFFVGSRSYPQRTYKYGWEGKKLTMKTYRIPSFDRYKTIQLKVEAPFIYLYDGTVPIISRSLVYDSVFSDRNLSTTYFSQFAVLDTTALALRYYNDSTKGLELGLMDIGNRKFHKRDGLLKGRGDGIFNRDGFLLKNAVSPGAVYLHYYSNRYVVVDKNLERVREGKTIDPISEVNVKTIEMQDGTRKRMGRPPIVNSSAYLYGNVLLVQSVRRGKLDNFDGWDKHDVLDIYDVDSGKYIGSLRLEHERDDKLKGLVIIKGLLHVVRDKSIVSYSVSEKYLKYFEAGEAENLK